MVADVLEQAKLRGSDVLESIKTLFGIDDDIKARDEYQSSFHSDSLGSLLPYLGWHDEADLFVLDSGEKELEGAKNLKKHKGQKNYLGFCLEANPQTGADDSMESILQSLFIQAPAGTSISVHLYASPDIMPQLKASARKRYSDSQLGIEKEPHERRNKNIYQVMARKNIDYYLHGTGKSLFPDGNNLLIRNFRLVISVVTKGSYRSETDIEQAILLRDQIKSTLQAASLPPIIWKPDHLINFVSDFFDHSRIFHVPSKLDKHYETHTQIRDQIVSRELETTVGRNMMSVSNAMSKEDSCIIQMTVTQHPKSFHLAEMSGLIGDFFQGTLSYPCPFMVTTSAVVQDYDAMRNKAGLKTATAVRKTEGYWAKFDSKLGEEAHEWKTALKNIDDGGTLIKMYTNITLITPKKTAAKARSEVMSIWRSKGFRLAEDRYQQLVSFLSSLPMSLTPPMVEDLKKMKRFSTKYSQNAVSLSPYIGEWKGTPTPVMNFIGRRGQLVGLDFFDNNAGNFNFAIVGASGSGKTFVTQKVLLSYRAIGAKIWVIDVGRGYENLCKMLDGDFVEFTEEANIIINPFTHISDLNGEMGMLKPLIAQMMSPDNSLTAWEMSAIEQAITTVYGKLGNRMTITDLADYLKSDEGEVDGRRKDLGAMLFPWTRDGAFGKYFDGEANISFQNDFTVLELEELKGKTELQAVVLMIMMYRISQEMYLTRDRKKVVLIDEAWSLMSSGMTGEFIETGYRRARKYGGAFGTATQGYGDYKGGAIAALNNADWTITLRQKDESISSMEEMKILGVDTDPYKRRIIKGLKKIDGKYSEMFVSYPDGEGVVRYVTDPFEQILFSSKTEHFNRVTEYRSQGMNVVQAVEQAMHDFGLPTIEPLKYE